MADKPAVIRATFSDWRPVKSRKVLQLILEVPVEQTEQVLQTLGAPMPDAERWVAVALLQPEKPAQNAVPDRQAVAYAPGRRRFSELPRSQQAGIRCDDPEFARWAIRNWGMEGDSAADVVRWRCQIASRAELDTNNRAARIWDEIDAQFLQDTGRMATDPRAA